MAENKQEPRQLRKPGHDDRQTDGQTGSECSVGETVRQKEDRLAVVKWRTRELCGTSREVLKGYSEDLPKHSGKDSGLKFNRMKQEVSKSMQLGMRYPNYC